MASDLVAPALGDRRPRQPLRHAAGSPGTPTPAHKGSWTGPDGLRPAVAGRERRQAEGLVVRLEDYPVEQILCSPTVRCYETVQPLALDRFLEIEHVAALGVEATPAQLLCWLSSSSGSWATRCWHPRRIDRQAARGWSRKASSWGADGGGPKGSHLAAERAGRRPVRVPLFLSSSGREILSWRDD